MASPLRRSPALLALALLVPCAGAQQIWRVDAAAKPGGDGATWATALSSLQKALDVATPADEIWLAAGTYRPVRLGDPSDPRSARFALGGPISIFGGFDGSESSRDEREPELFDDTVLSGDIGVAGDPSDNAYRVVDVSAAFPNPAGFARLDGLRVSGANGPGLGGGVFVKGPGAGGFPPKLMMVDCVLSENQAQSGGALVVRDFGVARVQRCVFERNVGVARGGAIYVGTGLLVAVDTRFSNNKSMNLGGAFFSHSGEDPRFARFVNCTFSDNRARLGGVAYLHGEEDYAGGGTWIHCTLARNVATEAGGAIYAVRNTRRRAQADVFNSILWGNHAPAQRSISGAGLDVRYSDVELGYAGVGNLAVDPQFLGDLRPRAGSPVNDAGDNALLIADMLDSDADGNTAEPLPLDLLDRVRRADDPSAPDTGAGIKPFVDMGAFEMDGGPRRPGAAPAGSLRR